eukprot:scaffold10552_cov276-Chaetoceros_neogracile.AAC.45
MLDALSSCSRRILVVFHEVSRETCTTVFLVEVRKIPLKDEIGRLENEDAKRKKPPNHSILHG